MEMFHVNYWKPPTSSNFRRKPDGPALTHRMTQPADTMIRCWQWKQHERPHFTPSTRRPRSIPLMLRPLCREHISAERDNVLAPPRKVGKAWFIHGMSYLLPRVDAVADPRTSGLGTALTQGTIIHLDRKKIRKSDTTASLGMERAAAAQHVTSPGCTVLLTFIPLVQFRAVLSEEKRLYWPL